MAYPPSNARDKRTNIMLGFAGVIVVLVLIAAGHHNHRQAFAQDGLGVPPRSAEAVQALQTGKWEQLEPGLKSMALSTALGTKLTALRIDVEHFRFSIEQQEDSGGETVASALSRLGGVAAVNGGFFANRGNGELFPVGRLIDEGESLTTAWRDAGGYLAIDPSGAPQITLSRDGTPEWAHDAIQSKPVILEPGGRWAMRTNTNDPARRTLFCKLDEREFLLLIVSGRGLSLYEAGWLLRDKARGGYFGCDSAIALDGGSSTQMRVEAASALNVAPLAAVQNFLMVHRRTDKTQ